MATKPTAEQVAALIGLTPKPKGVAGRKPGCAKHGGRRPGSKNLIPLPVGEMRDIARAKIWDAFNQLGGVRYLVELGKTRPELFLQVLARVLPAVPREDGGALVNVDMRQQAAPLSTLEAARKVAFALAAGAYQLGQEPPVESCRPTPRWEQAEPVVPPFEQIGESRQAMANTAKAAARDALVADTFERDITSYAGSKAEQGMGHSDRKEVVKHHNPTLRPRKPLI